MSREMPSATHLNPGESSPGRWCVSTRCRIAVLAATVAVVSAAHYSLTLELPVVHDLMDRLYYIPIVLAAFWFGRRGGLAVGFCSMLAYVPHIIQWEVYGHHHDHPAYGNKYVEAALYPLAGWFFGYLMDTIAARNASLSEAYRDLLASHDAAQRSAKLATAGQIAAGLAHEIKNPLSGLRGSIEVLSDRIPAEDETGREFVNRSMAEIKRIDGLVRDFVSFGRPSPVEPAPVDLPEVVRDIAGLLSAEARKHRVRIEVSDAAKVAPVLLDANKIKQALLNMMLNSVEAMPEGGTLSIDIARDADELVVTIDDGGSGIAGGTDVFEPFVTSKPQGSGLGLPTARQIIEAHGGSLNLVGKDGPGTRFVMRLPATSVEEQKQ